MQQRDYILRIATEVGRALAQVLYQRQTKDFQAAHELIDQQLKQAMGMGSNFIHAVSEETLLSMLTALGRLNIDKCWLIAMLLKAEGDLYTEQENENDSYYSYLKACNLFLEALYDQNQSSSDSFEKIPEIEGLLDKLASYELPLRTQRLLFWYFEQTNRYTRAEDVLFAILDSEHVEMERGGELEEVLAQGEAFYGRLVRKDEATLEASHFSRNAIKEGLARLQTHHV